MNIVSIETALETLLMTLQNSPRVAWEDLSFTPVTGQGYLRVNHLHNNPRDPYLQGGDAELVGIFQVTVIWPAGKGKVVAKQWAEKVAALFSPVQTLEAGAYNVALLATPAIASGFNGDDGWYSVPVSISWRAFPS